MPIKVKGNGVSQHSLTSFPAVISDNAKSNVPSYSILGNGNQNGTPTPDNPIQPEFVGVKTKNMMPSPSASTETKNGLTCTCDGNGKIALRGTASADTQFIFTIPEFTVPVAVGQGGGGTFSMFNSFASTSIAIVFYNKETRVDSWGLLNINRTTTTYATMGGKLVTRMVLTVATGVSVDGQFSLMLTDDGQLPKKFEPYGYEIPITCAGQTTPVYLGEVPTMRRVKKLVLDGTENWENNFGQSLFDVQRLLDNAPFRVGITAYSTHFRYNPVQSGINDKLSNGEFALQRAMTVFNIFFKNTDFTSTADFKAWLADQYAAGTPVTVWYVLTEPETSIVNEPLAKIGDYADEVLSTAEGAPQLTLKTESSNTIDFDMSLKPSAMNISYYEKMRKDVTHIYTKTGKEIKHGLDASGNIVFKSPSYYSWQGIREIVRAGKAPQYYPLGSILYDNFDPATGTAFQVVGYDKHFDPALTAQGYTHSMTLCELLLDDVITMDAIEAFLYTSQALPAGTYKFTIPNYDDSYGGNKIYYFTSTAELPTNSQIVMNWPHYQTPKTVTGYAPTASLTAMENTTAATGWNALTLTEWVDGTSPAATDLGTIAGPTNQAGTSSYGQMNHIHRARYGSNNYLQSGARQYLNSDKTANQWWTPQTIFDRPYGGRSLAGKLTKLSPSFVDVLAKPKIQSRTNQYFETTSLDGTTFSLSTNYNIQTDRLFLLSPVEIGFSTSDTTVGTLMGYYQGATDAKRIKYRKSNGNAYYWWLRTPFPSNCGSFRYVGMTGSLNLSGANGSCGIPAACCIQ